MDRPTGNPRSGVLAHVNEAGFSSSGTSYDWETGYQETTIRFGQAGTYTLTLGLHDVEDTYRDAAVVFDGFTFYKSPEPDTFALLAAGLLGLAVHGHWLKRSGDKD
jgi:hypothetical protein